MEVEYVNEKVRSQCESVKEAKKLFGGDLALTEKLLSRIGALKSASVLKDIVVQPQFRFHSLHNNRDKKLQGFFVIDVKTRKEAWRIILQPLDENKKPFDPCNIDEIAGFVHIIKIREVSKHYE